MPIVTKESLTQDLLAAPTPRRIKLIGRALVVLYNNQTAAEQAAKTTKVHNNVGFASCDAELGTRCAEGFIRYNNLLQWQIDAWMRTDARGTMRIAKYHRQLNDAAEAKAARRQQTT